MMPGHLTIGSEQPPKTDGKLRLYSMEFCPYAQGVRLVLITKNIPHDTVNIDLFNKPDWYFKVHPEGKVPALDTGNEVIVDSLVISDYLDSKYPKRPLYPSDPEAKGCVIAPEEKSLDDWKKEFASHLKVFEDELTKRGTPFFGGDKPGMIDFMLWPWGERVGMVTIRLGQRLPFSSDELPLIRRWKKLMKQQPECQATYHSPEELWKVATFLDECNTFQHIRSYFFTFLR